ncbi:MAG: SDR family NAD(P)-dependent oxidoreductase [Herbiconiux sp.]|uniref:SDR family NAD(P)-dependent oxidoreductase n=1 Tax=Herbiconiux sp. TaxID=1871186 RepID=UPI0012046C84|nr:SDR family NAD(P)-dependent oxidoreductase [Herbiconiux sp.]TAJ46296.1 MAG: SDR family NAD(P)-dependent oxidoreductase [Herbiconiux sp.]
MAETPSPRTIVITGASSGIGAVAAAHFAERGDEVVVVGRNPDRTRAVARTIGAQFHLADFDRLDEVRSLGEALRARHDSIDVLLNNAGGLVSKRTETADGHDATIQSNYLAPFLLTRMLLPQLEESARHGGTARVIGTSSLANRWGHLDLDDLDSRRRPWRGGWRAYGTAKLAVVLFTRELARRTAAEAAAAAHGTSAVEAYCVHPGTVVTGFGTGSPLIRFGTALTGGHWGVGPEVGAAPLIALASDAPVPAASGAYFDRMRPNGAVAAQARDTALQAELWTRTEKLLGLPAK